MARAARRQARRVTVAAQGVGHSGHENTTRSLLLPSPPRTKPSGVAQQPVLSPHIHSRGCRGVCGDGCGSEGGRGARRQPRLAEMMRPEMPTPTPLHVPAASTASDDDKDALRIFSTSCCKQHAPRAWGHEDIHRGRKRARGVFDRHGGPCVLSRGRARASAPTPRPKRLPKAPGPTPPITLQAASSWQARPLCRVQQGQVPIAKRHLQTPTRYWQVWSRKLCVVRHLLGPNRFYPRGPGAKTVDVETALCMAAERSSSAAGRRASITQWDRDENPGSLSSAAFLAGKHRRRLSATLPTGWRRVDR